MDRVSLPIAVPDRLRSNTIKRNRQLFHYRGTQQREVDLILERHGGEIVKVKASGTPASGAGLRYLREKLGARLNAGVVLHAGADTLPFGDRLAAVPISGQST
ncbi:MAG: hypothetical protein ACR2LV_12045 [Solirubrobacteraceae bacterium]